MGYINPKGRDWSSVVNFDSLGKFYVGFIVAWTVILCGGMAWLIFHRRLQSIKIRNIPLALAATMLLHVYLIKILLAYTINGHFPCTPEFWIMSIYLPFGIALFQANMLQLQSVSGQQKKLLESESAEGDAIKPTRGLRTLWNRYFSTKSVAKRNELFVAAGMIAQLIVTLAIYLASRKFHGSWGIVSKATTNPKCRKGWEWIPSAIWQMIFSWVYGPFILYKIRNIHDIHYWRLQTTLCVISGLPGTPLWLAAVYSTSFKSINKYWVPPMWLAPGIIMMQFVTIFFPIFEAYRSRSQLRSTMDIIRAWEESKKEGSAGSATDFSDYSGSTRNDLVFSSSGHKQASSHNSTAISTTTSTNSGSSRRKELYTMAAMEKALTMNPIPLLQFAATKEFSGENIRFLMHVRDWRAAWNRTFGTQDSTSATAGADDDLAKRHLFSMAVDVYTLNISSKTAEFPINIEGRFRSALDKMFGSAAGDISKHVVNADMDLVDPFNHPSPTKTEYFEKAAELDLPSAHNRTNSHELPQGFAQSNDSADTLKGELTPTSEKSPVSPPVNKVATVESPDSPKFVVPNDFDEHIFDSAEASVKWMVITNTWPKFVASRQEGSW